MPVRSRRDHIKDLLGDGNAAVFNFLAVDPETGLPVPFAFGESWWLMVEDETSDLDVLFSGAKCNMRKKKVTV